MLKITKLLFLFALLQVIHLNLNAQSNQFSIGAHLEWNMESPSYAKLYSINGKYDFSERQAIQAQVGLGDYKVYYFGADYLYTVLLLKKMPSVFVGAGLGFEGIRGTDANDIILNAQAGFQFDIKKFSPFVGYKPKFYFEAEGIDPSTIFIGLRYRL